MTSTEVKSAKFITGLIFNNQKICAEVERHLAKKFGRIDFQSPVLDFNLTDYYNEELGKNLKRKFLSFKRIFDLEKAVILKLYTVSLEDRFKIGGRRQINIDPGYVTLGKLILITRKDYSHRIYLKKGVCAEVTLFYKHGSFNPWPWTYPDYKTSEYIDFFNSVRNLYKNQLKRI